MTKKIQYNKKIMTKHLFYCNKTLIDFIKNKLLFVRIENSIKKFQI